jgi:glycogenin glucosyltransferase
MAKHAYVTFIIRNDSFLPGALVFAYGLRRQNTPHDLICIVSDTLQETSIEALKVLFDDVIVLKDIFVPHKNRQERQDRPFLFSRFHALRLGKDGDLGKAYDKILIADADVLPLRYYDALFEVDAPAGVINEKKEYCMDYKEGKYIVPKTAEKTGEWHWHEIYKDYSMGSLIPKSITNRVDEDKTNMGINAALYLFEPSMKLYESIQKDLKDPVIQDEISAYPWPEMQYITKKMSGQWHNLDLRYSSFNGYPKIDVLYGIHYAGLKPWQMNHRSVPHFGKFEDYRLWYAVFLKMVTRYPTLRKSSKIAKLDLKIREQSKNKTYQFERVTIPSVSHLF